MKIRVNTKVVVGEVILKNIMPTILTAIDLDPATRPLLRMCPLCGDYHIERTDQGTPGDVFIDLKSQINPCHPCELIRAKYPAIFVWLDRALFFQKHTAGVTPTYITMAINLPETPNNGRALKN